MAEVEKIPLESADPLEQVGKAEVVIGLASCDHPAALASAEREIRAAIGDPDTAVILHCDSVGITEAAPPHDHNGSGGPVRLAPYPFPANPDSRFASILPVLEASQRLHAKACCVWNGAPEKISSTTIHDLLHPVWEDSFDLAVARYAGLRYDALINSSIVYPLTRALYGLRIRYPMATDLAFSANLRQRLLQPDPKTGAPVARNWIPSFAACEKFRIAQVDLDLKQAPSSETDASAALVTILEPLFADVQRNANHWQRTRGSQPVPTFGTAPKRTEIPPAIGVHRMIEAFHLGWGNLREVWSPILPPASLLQVKKLAALPEDRFRIADDLWARCVFDFALGYHLRLMSADHLIRAFTPLYLAWVASYALEVQSLSPAQVEERLEHLCLAFEANKPYFLSRWRWPDRFNP